MEQERRSQLVSFLTRFRIRVASNLDLINTALTHSSYAYESGKEIDNERLEFLGDAVIGSVAAHYVYDQYPLKREGELSKMKSVLVSRRVLAKRAMEMGIGDFLLLGKGEERSGGRSRGSLVGGALEALVGALYQTIGFKKTCTFIQDYLLEPSSALLNSERFIDFKSRLQELCQKEHNTVPEYHVVNEQGPDHAKLFTVEVLIEGTIMGKGSGIRKKRAENEAAKAALEKLIPPKT